MENGKQTDEISLQVDEVVSRYLGESPTRTSDTSVEVFSDAILCQKLDLLEQKGNKDGDLLMLKFVKIERELLDLYSYQQANQVDLSSRQQQRVQELEERLQSVEKAMRFCEDFIRESEQVLEQRRAEEFERKMEERARKERAHQERQERLRKCREITVDGQDRAIKVSRISNKTLEWLKSIMDRGLWGWEDYFVFEICDRNWVTKAATIRNVDVCLELFWHLILLEGLFPGNSQLEALAVRTGTPSVEELTSILRQSNKSAWLKMTKAHMLKKGVTEVEFKAMLGHADAQKKLEKQMQQDGWVDG